MVSLTTASSTAAGGEAVKHLRYDCIGAAYAGKSRHPQVIRELGIMYELAIPQSMGDQWWFLIVSTQIYLNTSPKWNAITGWQTNTNSLVCM